MLLVYANPKFHSVLLHGEPFSRLQKIRSAPNYLGLILNTWRCIYKLLTPEAQILARFARRPAVSRNKVQLVETRIRTEWLQTDLEHLIVKSTLYIFPRAKVWSVSLYEQPFSRQRTFNNSSLTSIIIKRHKFKNWNSRISLTLLKRRSRGVYTWLLTCTPQIHSQKSCILMRRVSTNFLKEL